ncbi:MAG TPA: hypothetical protein VK195_08180 [Burkholderiaceae bacterium]|nr:hypothetical protein [Burkholderiaceae bacterium]
MRNGMKKLGAASAAVLVMSAGGLAHGAEPAVPAGSEGSNITGQEHVCGNGEAKTLAETYANCKRGDLIGLGRASPLGVMSVCDFSKTILYTKGEAIACVYTGAVRQSAK